MREASALPVPSQSGSYRISIAHYIDSGSKLEMQGSNPFWIFVAWLQGYFAQVILTYSTNAKYAKAGRNQCANCAY